jgi:hypothetical protein
MKTGQKVKIIHNSYGGRYDIGAIVYLRIFRHDHSQVEVSETLDEWGSQIYAIGDIRALEKYANEEEV